MYLNQPIVLFVKNKLHNL